MHSEFGCKISLGFWDFVLTVEVLKIPPDVKKEKSNAEKD